MIVFEMSEVNLVQFENKIKIFEVIGVPFKYMGLMRVWFSYVILVLEIFGSSFIFCLILPYMSLQYHIFIYFPQNYIYLLTLK